MRLIAQPRPQPSEQTGGSIQQLCGAHVRLSISHNWIHRMIFRLSCWLRFADFRVCAVTDCFNLEDAILTVYDGKGQKDRTVPLPMSIMPGLREHLNVLRMLHERDMQVDDYAGVFLPRQYEKKAKHAAKAFTWQWFFPAPRLTRVSGLGNAALPGPKPVVA